MPLPPNASELPSVKACGVLIFRGTPPSSFLLMKHAHRWDLPKGHIEPGETDIACALREMEEETGIPRAAITLDPTFRWVSQYIVRDKHIGGREALKTLIIFLGRLQREVPINTTEHPDYAWFPWPASPIQQQTIDPLLVAVDEFFSRPSTSS